MAMACLHRAEALSQGSEMDMGYGGNPMAGWFIYVYFMENPKQKWIVHHFHICSLDWLKGKMKPENPIYLMGKTMVSS